VAEYIQTFELDPRCPLYLGLYLYKEGGPDGKRRREYMCRLIDVYQFYGLRLDGREYPDFLPVVAEFLWFTLGVGEHRPRLMLIRDQVLPALPELETRLSELGSPYAHLVRALKSMLEFELSNSPKEAKYDAVPA